MRTDLKTLREFISVCSDHIAPTLPGVKSDHPRIFAPDGNYYCPDSPFEIVQFIRHPAQIDGYACVGEKAVRSVLFYAGPVWSLCSRHR